MEENVEEACDLLKNKCIACAVSAGKPEYHSLPSCPKMRGRCLRCFEFGHSVMSCSVTKEKARVQGRACYNCGFSHSGAWGSQCDRRLEKVRDTALAAFSFKIKWVHSMFPQCQSFQSKDQYVSWLFENDEGLGMPNVMVLCSKWWNRG